MEASIIWQKILKHKEATEKSMELTQMITDLKRYVWVVKTLEPIIDWLETERAVWEKIRNNEFQELKEFLLYHPDSKVRKSPLSTTYDDYMWEVWKDWKTRAENFIDPTIKPNPASKI